MSRTYTCVLLLILFNLIFITGLGAHQNQAKIVRTQLSENLYKLHLSEFVNMVVFVGIEGTLLVDSAFEETADEVRTILNGLGGSEIKYIINTHSDYDHVAGNRTLGKNACVMSHVNCRLQLIEYAAPDFDIPFDKAILRGALPTISFQDLVTLYFNGEEIQIIPLIGGHTDEDVIVYFKKAGVVCLGDVISPDSFPVVKLNNGGDPEILAKNVERLIALFPSGTSFVVGHGREMPKEELRSYHDMLTSTIALIKTALGKNMSVEEIKQNSILKDWAHYSDPTYDETKIETWIKTVYTSLVRKNRFPISSGSSSGQNSPE